jgi:hypothetical protein
LNGILEEMVYKPENENIFLEPLLREKSAGILEG